MPNLADVGERGAIEVLRMAFDRGLPIGIGHDCGVAEWGDDYLVATTDVIHPKTHLPAGATPRQIGGYLIAVNLSDIAAVGAQPLGVLAALSLPRTTEVEWLRELAKGMEESARSFGTTILGGDTKESDTVSLAGTAVGRVPKASILLRSGARPGDVVVLTGSLGRAGWAVRALTIPEETPRAIELLLQVIPRILEGQFFSRSGAVTSCMDVSDGLGATLATMAGMSKVSFHIDLEALPIYRGLREADPKTVREAALYYGGDFELVATVRPEGLEPLLEKYRDVRPGQPARLSVIGTVAEAGENVLIAGDRPERLEPRGFEHFR